MDLKLITEMFNAATNVHQQHKSLLDNFVEEMNAKNDPNLQDAMKDFQRINVEINQAMAGKDSSKLFNLMAESMAMIKKYGANNTK